jgi:hypothetical protein
LRNSNLVPSGWTFDREPFVYVFAGNTSIRRRLSTVDLLIKVTYLVKEYNSISKADELN